ncbi:hypothetical protein D3H64_09695 [Atopobacter sp. AH10]|uniref:tetratricopeptide repeat protein n=1 Tax=Atopobacter sp. AH10 TaxID=2315861 RepID=UPI000EF1FD8A|nr:hypothetical protein [Atopobacter sp. AH10]RLK62440.1 hypothetical protein D3H64_09695 [Atopobacter sp. AH10]
MDFEREQMVKRIQEFLEEHGAEYSSIEMALEAAKNKWNNGELEADEQCKAANDNKLEASAQYNRAQYCHDDKLRKKFLEKAYRLDPDNLDFAMAYYLETQPLHQAYESLSKVEKDYFKKHRKVIGKGYGHIENRPYFRLKHELIFYYAGQKLLRKAIKEAKESLKLNPNDNLGVRYLLMICYVLIADYQSARELYRTSEYSELDDNLTLCLLTVSVLDGRLDEGKRLTKQLLKINPSITQFFNKEEFDVYMVCDSIPIDDYIQRNSKESLALIFDQLSDLYLGSDYLYQKIKGFLEELDPKAFEQQKHRSMIPFRSRELAGKGIFKNIKPQYVYNLLLAGFETKKDFKSVSKKEILAVPMIGKVILQRLEENGVRFKDS